MASTHRGMLGDRKAATSHVRSTGAEQTIDNPFLTLDDSLPNPTTRRTVLEEYVDHFTRQSGLQHRTYLLEFAARLARDKDGAMIRYRGEITEPEWDLIDKEKDDATGFWRQSKFFKATSKRPICRTALTDS
jgi:hypothetical protein